MTSVAGISEAYIIMMEFGRILCLKILTIFIRVI